MEAPTNPGRIGFKELRLTIKRLSRQYWAELRKREVDGCGDGTDEISALMNQHRDRVLAEAEAERELAVARILCAQVRHGGARAHA